MNYYYINKNLDIVDKPIYDNTCLRCKSTDTHIYYDPFINCYSDNIRECKNCKYMFKPRIKGYYKDFKNPTFDGIFEPEDYVTAKLELLRNNPKNI